MNGNIYRVWVLTIAGLLTGCATQPQDPEPGMLSFSELGAAISITREAELPADQPQAGMDGSPELVASSR